MAVKGFTFIETLITLSIVAISLGFAVSMMANYIVNSKLRSTAEEIINAIQLSRSEAIKRSDTVKFTVSINGGWVIAVYINGKFTPFKTKTSTTGIRVNPGEIKFDSYGKPNQAITFSVTPTDGVCTNKTCMNVQLNGFGKSKLCNPASSNEVVSC